MAENQPPSPLFTVPIAALDDHPGGSIVCTEPAPAVYLLTFSSPPDNRLTTAFCTALLAALDVIELSGRFQPGVVVTTSAIPKFYSNGLDLAHATETPGFWSDTLYALFRRFLTYPMPTLALLNGHAFAAGFMLAMHHDYRVFSPARGFLCLNEVEFGAPLAPPMSGIFRLKCAPQTYRALVLEARRFGGRDALAAGLVDAVGGLPEALALVSEKGLTAKGHTGVYGALKAEMYRECVGYLGGWDAEAEQRRRVEEVDEKRREDGRRRIEELGLGEGGKGDGKAKL